MALDRMAGLFTKELIRYKLRRKKFDFVIRTLKVNKVTKNLVLYYLYV